MILTDIPKPLVLVSIMIALAAPAAPQSGGATSKEGKRRPRRARQGTNISNRLLCPRRSPTRQPVLQSVPLAGPPARGEMFKVDLVGTASMRSLRGRNSSPSASASCTLRKASSSRWLLCLPVMCRSHCHPRDSQPTVCCFTERRLTDNLFITSRRAEIFSWSQRKEPLERRKR